MDVVALSARHSFPSRPLASEQSPRASNVAPRRSGDADLVVPAFRVLRGVQLGTGRFSLWTLGSRTSTESVR